MKNTSYVLIRYDADDNKVFDWKEPRYIDIFDDNGNVINQEQEHLYAKTLFIGESDDINNYIEIDKPID